MASRRQARNFRSSRPARGVEWARGVTTETTLIGVGGGVSAAVFDIGSFFPFLQAAVSPTIVRIRGVLDIAADSTSGMTLYGAGFVKGSVKAVSAGIAAIPIPILDDADWQWYSAGSLGDSTALGGAIPEEDILHVMIDTKSMRKYEQDDQTLLFVMSNQSGIAGDDLLFRCCFSVLIKE